MKNTCKKRSFFRGVCISLILMFFLDVPLSAQDATGVITVQGLVLDEENQDPVIGASIVVVGNPKKGTITDIDGRFTLKVNAGSVLRITSVSYQPREQKVTKGGVLKINLLSSQKAINEVVVVGYQQMRKSDLTGSVTSISSNATLDRVVTSLSDVMKGKAAGVSIIENDGTPGGGSTIRIRGASSINGDNDPLYVIDGVPGGNSDVNPGDIASIEILKDASSTAIYGSKGANGVILITTKKGVKGKPKIDLYANFGIQKVGRKLEMMNSVEYEKLRYDQKRVYTLYEKRKDNMARAFYDDEMNIYQIAEGWGDWNYYNHKDSVNTNWQDVIFQEAWTEDYRLSISGGLEKSNYAFMLGYFSQDGVIVNSGIKKYSGRFNFNQQITNWMRMNVTVNASQNDRNGIITGSSTSVINNALTQAPTKHPTAAETELVPGEEENVNNNPYYQLMNSEVVRRYRNMGGSLNLEFDLYKGLKFKTMNAYYGSDIWSSDFYPKLTSQGNKYEGQAKISTSRYNKYISENLLTYDLTIKKIHRVNALLGASFEKEINRNLDVENRNFDIEELGSDAIQQGVNPQVPFSNFDESRMASFFGRVNYSLLNRYLLTFSMRTDGSSKFGAENKFATFPSGAIAWRLSEEPFMKNVKVISNLKLRASYGTSGNQAIPNYRSLAALAPSLTPIDGETPSYGVIPDRVANPHLKWETTDHLDFGLDLNLFNNRLGVVIDMYKKVTRDLLMQLAVPNYTGYSNYWTNHGSIENKGLEIVIDATPIESQRNGFRWNTNFNISFNRSKVLEMGEDGEMVRSPGAFGDCNLVREGQPLGLWYGWKQEGIFQSRAEIKASGLTEQFGTKIDAMQPGWRKIENVNGDKSIDNSDRQILGCAEPDFTGGFTNRFSYKGFELSFMLQFSFGADIFNATSANLTQLRAWPNQLKIMNDRWSPNLYAINEDGTKGELVVQGNPSQKYVGNGYVQESRMYSSYIEDGSYLKLSDVTLSYTFPRKWMKPLFVQSLRLFASGKNLAVLTNYSGYDPEVSTSNNRTLAPGMDWSAYPKSRIFSFGLNVTF